MPENVALTLVGALAFSWTASAADLREVTLPGERV
jgi:hypothetical protein